MPDAPPTTLHDIESAEPFLDAFWMPWWLWALAILLGLIILAALVWLLTRRPGSRHIDPNQALRASTAAIAELRARLDTLSVAQVATATSLTLRQYLADLTNDPALYETREEFISRADALAKLNTIDRNAIASFFDDLAKLKYAPIVSSNDCSSLLDRSEALLQQLHLSLPHLPR